MPGTVPQSKIMQATGNLHHQVTDTILPVAHFLLDDATPLHAPDRMLNAHFRTRNLPIVCFLLGCQFTAPWLLGWLLDRNVHDRKALKSHVLIQHTASGQPIVRSVNNGFLVPLARIRLTHKPNITRFISQQNVFDGMTFLLSAVVFLLFIGIYWSLNGAFRPIMIKKGVLLDVATSASATTVARRTGRTSSLCN